jgi:hypothetical protein
MDEPIVELPELALNAGQCPERWRSERNDCVGPSCEGSHHWTREQRDGMKKFALRLLDELAQRERQLRSAIAQIAALTKQVEELTGERDRSREARRNHAETLRGIARMDPTTDGERMRQWARDGLSGYVATYEMTLREFEQRVEKAEAELATAKIDLQRVVLECERMRAELATAKENRKVAEEDYAQALRLGSLPATKRGLRDKIVGLRAIMCGQNRQITALKAELAALRDGAKVTYRGEVFSAEEGEWHQCYSQEQDDTSIADARKAASVFGDVVQIVEITTFTRERILDSDPKSICPHCGPDCVPGAAHSARVEDGVLWTEHILGEKGGG